MADLTSFQPTYSISSLMSQPLARAHPAKMNEHRKPPRRRHSAQFKREVLAACNEPGASVAGVALAVGLNANLVRQWRRGRGFKPDCGAVLVPPAPPREAQQQFIALAIPPAAPASAAPICAGTTDIRIEVRRGALQVNVSWPQAAAADCAGWLRELLK